MIHKWKTKEVREAVDLKIFNVKWFKRYHPELKKESEFVVLNSPRWVNIIPITSEGNVVFVEQYRHGIDEITLEVPGGLIDINETPKQAAERECTEETGFIGDSTGAILLGENFPNPAFLNNVCYSFAWFNCKKVKEQKLDLNEDISVIEIPLKEIKQMIIDGQIRHSLVLTAFLFFFLKYGELIQNE